VAREDALEQVYLSLIPQRRLIETREIATMARYLASDEARSVTGRAINVSAGLIMH
jgi:3-hydroxybutyrate dehydrogenase